MLNSSTGSVVQFSSDRMAITADAMVRGMYRGISCGQVFESVANSRDSWRLHKLLDAWWARGFRHVRIPVTWYGDSTDTCKLNDSTFMAQLTDTVNYAVQKGFIVMLNAHHEHWLHNNYDMTELYNGRFWALWRDIALRFNYVAQNKLIFEILNEPQGVFGNWSGAVSVNDPGAIQRTQMIMKTGFDGVRFVSGTRIVACSTNGMGSVGTVNSIYPTKDKLPGFGNDRYVMAHVHTYDDWKFCGQDGSCDMYTCQSDPIGALHRDIDARFAQLAAWRDKLGGNAVVPVQIGEYGIGRMDQWKRDNALTREYYMYTTRRCMAYGIAPTVWDDGSGNWYATESIDSSGNVQFVFGLVDAIMSA
jgi:endoglucanase